MPSSPEIRAGGAYVEVSADLDPLKKAMAETPGLLETFKMAAKDFASEERASGGLALERVLRSGAIFGLAGFAMEELGKFAGALNENWERVSRGEESAMEGVLNVGKAIPIVGGIVDACENLDILMYRIAGKVADAAGFGGLAEFFTSTAESAKDAAKAIAAVQASYDALSKAQIQARQSGEYGETRKRDEITTKYSEQSQKAVDTERKAEDEAFDSDVQTLRENLHKQLEAISTAEKNELAQSFRATESELDKAADEHRRRMNDIAEKTKIEHLRAAGNEVGAQKEEALQEYRGEYNQAADRYNAAVAQNGYDTSQPAVIQAYKDFQEESTALHVQFQGKIDQIDAKAASEAAKRSAEAAARNAEFWDDVNKKIVEVKSRWAGFLSENFKKAEQGYKENMAPDFHAEGSFGLGSASLAKEIFGSGSGDAAAQTAKNTGRSANALEVIASLAGLGLTAL